LHTFDAKSSLGALMLYVLLSSKLSSREIEVVEFGVHDLTLFRITYLHMLVQN